MIKTLINWSDAYSIGHEEVDKQHQVLVELINKLYDAFLSAKAYEVVSEILDEMIDYTQYHFGFEHEIFEKYSYPDYEEHKTVHESFVMKTIEFKQKIAAGEKTVTYDIMIFLRDWLIEHIQGEDTKYVAYFKEQEIDEFL